jgi:hypothetical protein
MLNLQQDRQNYQPLSLKIDRFCSTWNLGIKRKYRGVIMRKKSAVPFLIAVLLITMACTISYEGINFGSDPEVEKIEDMTATAERALPAVPAVPLPAASTPEPVVTQPPAAQEPVTQADKPGPAEYSVTAQNFNCICQVNGNVTVEFTFKDDQLEIKNADGSADTFQKIGDNKYKKSWMGYYILSSGEGDNKVETKVDEERSVMIILNDNGYVMEHYQGDSPSPCCFYTFTNTK